jgi:hypothetical protein
MPSGSSDGVRHDVACTSVVVGVIEIRLKPNPKSIDKTLNMFSSLNSSSSGSSLSLDDGILGPPSQIKISYFFSTMILSLTPINVDMEALAPQDSLASGRCDDNMMNVGSTILESNSSCSTR